MSDSKGQLEKPTVVSHQEEETPEADAARLEAILNIDDIRARNGDDSLELVRLLGKCGARIFENLPADEVAKAMGYQLKPRLCKPHEVICRQGTEAQAAFVVLSGEVQSWRRCHFGDPFAQQALEDGEREAELLAKGIKGKLLETAMAVQVKEAKAAGKKPLTIPEDSAPSIWCDLMQSLEAMHAALSQAQLLFPGPSQLEFLGGDAWRLVLLMDETLPLLKAWIAEAELSLHGDLDDIWAYPTLALKGQSLMKDLLKFGSDAEEMQRLMLLRKFYLRLRTVDDLHHTRGSSEVMVTLVPTGSSSGHFSAVDLNLPGPDRSFCAEVVLPLS